MASERLFLGFWTPATLRTFQVPLRANQLKVKAFYTRVGALADLKISKACRNIYRRIFSGGVIAWHGRNDLRDTTGLPFANLTRIDKMSALRGQSPHGPLRFLAAILGLTNTCLFDMHFSL